MDTMTTQDVELREALAILAEMKAQTARIAERQEVQEKRTTELERLADQRIRGLEATVADQHETLALAGEAMAAVQAVCASHGHDPASGLSVIAWLEYVLDSAAAGWSSVN